jgi:hypothetical protein
LLVAGSLIRTCLHRIPDRMVSGELPLKEHADGFILGLFCANGEVFKRKSNVSRRVAWQPRSCAYTNAHTHSLSLTLSSHTHSATSPQAHMGVRPQVVPLPPCRGLLRPLPIRSRHQRVVSRAEKALGFLPSAGLGRQKRWRERCCWETRNVAVPCNLNAAMVRRGS